MEGMSAQQQAASAVAACTAQIVAQQQLQEASSSLNPGAEALHCSPQEISAAQLQTQLQNAHNDLAEYKGYLAEVRRILDLNR
jgi:hypothetical protein